MDSAARHQQAMEIFDRLCDLSPDQVVPVLREACGEDDALRRQVESLLKHDSRTCEAVVAAEEGGGVGLLAAWLEDDDVESEPEKTSFPKRIGQFRIIRVIGRGGMGVVYEAEQENPRRRVALKVVRSDLVSASLIKRFAREAHVLAMLKHPGIAHIYEAGTEETGGERIPFFAMEFIDGTPLNQHVVENRLGTPQKLALIARVADAVHSAHEKGVIHRDLKPANILVVGGPENSDSANRPSSILESLGQPKILDFGIARVTDADIQATTIQTRVGELVGTLAYMSPEQVGGNPADIDLRCDVYALGVMLYELLTGNPPHDLAGMPIPEAVRTIQEDEPTRLGTLNTSYRGDVETIIAKAMDKEPDQRYASAAELSADLQRYLHDEPILARAPSTFYQLRKFARRNRALVGGVVASFVLLLLGLTGTGLGWLSAYRNNAALQAANADLELMGEFQSERLADIDVAHMGNQLRRTILDSVDEDKQAALASALEGVNFTDTARKALEENIFHRSIKAIDAKFTERPLLQARLLQTFSTTSRDLGLHQLAHEPQARAVDLFGEVRGEEHADTLEARNNLARLTELLGKSTDAEAEFRDVIERQRRTLGDDHPLTLKAINNLGSLLYSQGKLDDAEKLFRESLQGRRRVLGPDHVDTLTVLGNYGSLLEDLGRLEEAEAMLAERVAGFRRLLGDDDPGTLRAIGELAMLLQQVGRKEEAGALLGQALAGRRRVLGDDHPSTLIAIGNLACHLEQAGQYDKALSLYRECMERHRRVLGNRHPNTLTAISNLGFMLNVTGKTGEAEPLYREALEGCRIVLGNDHPRTLSSIGNLGALLVSQGNFAEAESLNRESLAGRRKLLGDDHPSTLNAIYNMGNLLLEQGKLDDAETFCIDSLEGYRRARGPDNIGTLYSLKQLGSLYEARDDHEKAEKYYREALESWQRVSGDMHPETSRIMVSLAGVLASRQEWAEASAFLNRALEIARAAEPEPGPRVAWALEKLGRNRIAEGRYDEAEQLLAECLAIRKRVSPGDASHWNTLSLFAEAIAADPLRREEAERLQLEAVAGLKSSDADPRVVAEVRGRLIRLYKSWNKPEQAAKWREDPE